MLSGSQVDCQSASLKCVLLGNSRVQGNARVCVEANLRYVLCERKKSQQQTVSGMDRVLRVPPQTTVLWCDTFRRAERRLIYENLQQVLKLARRER